MPNMTITADEETLRWARIKAAELDTSVARLLGDILKQQMETERGYPGAMNRFLSVKPRVLSQDGYPAREELHDRARLR